LLVTTFGSLKPILRRIVLRVHPDVVSQLPPHCSALNATSLQTLFRLFDSLRARLPEERASMPAEEVAAGTQPLAEAYKFEFWHEPRAPEGAAEAAPAASPLLLQREVRVPRGLEAQCARLASAGRPASASAHWLALGADTLAVLGEGLGLCARGAVQLSPELRAAIRAGAAPKPGPGSSSSRSGAGMEPLSATEALRAHLRGLSPLQQGKDQGRGAATLAEAQALVAQPRSVFTLPQRRGRVQALLARPGWLTIDAAEGGSSSSAAAAASAMRLRQALLTHYDALFLYHSLWLGLRVAVGPNLHYMAQPATGCLTLPSAFSEAELVHLVRRSTGGQQERAVSSAAAAAAAAVSYIK
jgi:hypothetical protein